MMLIGTIVGIIFGAVPGLSSVMAIALFLPLTYGMDPGQGLSVLIALYIGSVSGGLISAILLKIPGTPASIATCLDGHPMLEKNEGAKALGVGVVFSFLGTIISIIALIFIAPSVAKIAIKFGPHEYFSIAVFSLMLIATLSTGSMVKGIFSGVLGFAFSTVGIAPVDAVRRFTFGSVELYDGFDILTVMIGLFAVSEVIKIAETSRLEGKTDVAKVNMKVKGFGFSIKEFIEQIPNGLRSSLIGLGIGILPGIGAGTSNLVSYTVAKNSCKKPEKYGQGCIDGIVASESANNASVGGALIPLMTLGIPGDGVTALLLGAFMVHGIAPGPLLFVNYGNLVYTIFIACIVAAVMMLIVEFYGMRIFAKILKVPRHILLPIVFVFCVVGAFGLSSRIFDVWAVVVFGVIGYFFVKFKVPQAPFVIGFVLGTMAETNLRRGLMMSQDSFSGFITNPISGAFLIATAIFLAVTIIKEIKQRRRMANQ
ncbi:tripartite tricarboxylate transporter permease [Alkalibacter sp. M17DMB]|nr:tripartite tricarboxylate transporter permease [Alkalibacter mobilis]